MKPTHLTTPRTLAECHFQTGYGPAPRRDWTEFGHKLVAIVGGVTIVMVLVLVKLGVL